jgi:DNA (cytosine-5)-methyltransferase 1
MGLEDQHIRGGGAGSSVAQCLTTGTGQRYDAETETLIPTTGAVFDDAVCFEANMSMQSPSVGGVHPTLTPRTHAAIAFPLGSEEASFKVTTGHDQNINYGAAVRRLTPVECERLQGFPDNYTAIPWRNKPADQCADGPRYKALGNSMAVPVMRWIGERIALVEAIEAERMAA